MKRRGAAPRRRRRVVPENRRRGAAILGAHPERRSLTPARRADLRRRAGAPPLRAAVVLPPVANMFAKPDPLSPVVSQATLGTSVAALDEARGFGLVETPDRYRGWIRSVALRPLPGRGGVYPASHRAFLVRNFICQIYRERDVTSASPLSAAPLLSPLEVTEEAGDWMRVLLPDGRRGWAQRGDLLPAGAAVADHEDIASTAMKFLGIPYLWGGTTPFGLDCSGLVQIVYRLHGHLLPRDADLQHADPGLAPVRREVLRAGDLVFFGPQERLITHVGIALEAGGFVSATTYRSPVVRIDHLDDEYWAGLYRGARRLKSRE
ncbi:MAG: C40 family peptidase [Acidobacteria bacterium]|nr:C40 family peptidase [Acidobacteriota bacterium]